MVPSIINRTKMELADVVITGLPFDRSSGLAGAEKGPEAVKTILDSQLELDEPITETTPVRYLGIAYEEIAGLNDTEDIGQMVATVRARYNRFFGNAVSGAGDKFPIAVGGDHSVSIGIFQALHDQMRHRRLPTILQIDAHFDLRESDADFRDPALGPYAHCSVMRRAAELGFPIVAVGVRSYSRDELDFAKTHKIIFFPWLTRNRPSPLRVVHAITTKDVYLTIDVDGIDPAHMPATGTPVQDGLTWRYTLELLETLFRNPNRNVVGMDITEVAPALGITNLTAYGAAQLIYTAIALKFEKRIRSELSRLQPQAS